MSRERGVRVDHLVTDLLPLTQGAVVAGFMGLAVLAMVRAPRSGRAGWWAAAAFGAFATALAGFWVPGWVDAELASWVGDVLWLLVLAFPYLLFRFTVTFRPVPRWLEVAAAAGAILSAVVLLFALSAGRGSGAAETVQVVFVLGYWAAVASVTVVRLWRAGRGQPGVARRRMRLMAVAVAVATVALVTATQLGDGAAWIELLAYVLALASAVTFGLGFAPPRSLRLSWRRQEDLRLEAASTAVLRSDTVEQVADHLLPAAVGIMGARGAALVDDRGVVVAAHGDAPAAGQPADDHVEGADGGSTRETASLGPGRGQLVAWTSAYTPFFAPEEVGLFHTVGAIGGLALERCELLAEQRARLVTLERARQQSEEARGEAERAREEADRANLAKSEFLSRMSHELRTPLNAVLGFGQLLETSTLTEDDRSSVDHILKAGRHLLTLIDDVLDLSRVEAGTLTISLEPVHSGELIADTIALVQPLATARSITIAADPSGCEDYVHTDRQRCRQILLNLLSNAIKYNHDGGRVELTCTRRGERLRIAVNDTGPGIDPARRDRLFEPFERLGAEGSGVEGTGLGLALTRELVERLQGEIGLQSAPGEGSTFWVELPITDPPPDLDDARGTTDGAERDSGLHRLLLVEDNLANLRLVEAMLRRRPGISVLPAMQGTLALELAYEHQPDLVVLDLHLPDMSGREVLNRLQADPRTRGIPVVIASADATPSRIRQLREDGAFAYITKPLDLHEFLDTIDRALGRRA